jgi:beta-glucanase (GH16 family)
MVLNIAVGGNWAGPPDDTTVWPQDMVVDWVRVYQKKKTIRDKS